MALNSVLEQIERLIVESKLGFLGNQITNIVDAYTDIRGEKEQELEDLKQRTIHVEFGRYGSSIEKAIRGKESKSRNFTLYFDIERWEWTLFPMHFYWEGSWEGLEEEMKRDVEILTTLGLKIDYKGYNPERNISF
ncbi:MAG: hypothetical protein Q7J54_01100 [Candidatus Woesearchaeota archaeon]|nr:hypothetical protein [Candidatus Woesearchaeota archaeon]